MIASGDRLTSAPTAAPVIYFYRKAGCHLCDDMARGLVEFAREMDGRVAFEVVARDIEDDERWYRRYREYVPVLVVGREEVCYYFLDKDELRAALSSDECSNDESSRDE